MSKKTKQQLLEEARAAAAEKAVWNYLRERLDTDLSVPEDDFEGRPRVPLTGVSQDDVDNVIEQVEEIIAELDEALNGG